VSELPILIMIIGGIIAISLDLAAG
jgi:hypothetical protein